MTQSERGSKKCWLSSKEINNSIRDCFRKRKVFKITISLTLEILIIWSLLQLQIFTNTTTTSTCDLHWNYYLMQPIEMILMLTKRSLTASIRVEVLKLFDLWVKSITALQGALLCGAVIWICCGSVNLISFRIAVNQKMNRGFQTSLLSLF